MVEEVPVVESPSTTPENTTTLVSFWSTEDTALRSMVEQEPSISTTAQSQISATSHPWSHLEPDWL